MKFHIPGYLESGLLILYLVENIWVTEECDIQADIVLSLSSSYSFLLSGEQQLNRSQS
jgi:hypothetical protein